MKRFLIKLFNLAELENEILKASRRMEEECEKRRIRDLLRQEERLNAEKEYELANKEAIIESRDREITALLRREREIDKKELWAKTQVKANVNVAAQLYVHIKNISHYISKECAEIHHVIEEIDEHKKMIENKK